MLLQSVFSLAYTCSAVMFSFLFIFAFSVLNFPKGYSLSFYFSLSFSGSSSLSSSAAWFSLFFLASWYQGQWWSPPPLQLSEFVSTDKHLFWQYLVPICLLVVSSRLQCSSWSSPKQKSMDQNSCLLSCCHIFAPSAFWPRKKWTWCCCYNIGNGG